MPQYGKLLNDSKINQLKNNKKLKTENQSGSKIWSTGDYGDGTNT